MASGEMTDAEFLAFNEAWIGAVFPFLRDGGVFGTFIDWRSQPTVHAAATKLGLKPLNLILSMRAALVAAAGAALGLLALANLSITAPAASPGGPGGASRRPDLGSARVLFRCRLARR
jgi:hypothetical protein